jgi:hypothetical protein
VRSAGCREARPGRGGAGDKGARSPPPPTDPADIRSACRQAAVAVVGLRDAVARLGAADPIGLVPAVADLVLLGSRTCEELAPAGSLRRAVELLVGRGAPPRDSAEQLLQQQLREACREYTQAVGDVR